MTDLLSYYGLLYCIQNDIDLTSLEPTHQEFIKIMKNTTLLYNTKIDAIVQYKFTHFIEFQDLVSQHPQYFRKKIIETQWEEGLNFILTKRQWENNLHELIKLVIQQNWDNGLKILFNNSFTLPLMKLYIQLPNKEKNIEPYAYRHKRHTGKMHCPVKQYTCNYCFNTHEINDKELACDIHINKNNLPNFKHSPLTKYCKQCCFEKQINNNCQLSLCKQHIQHISKLYINFDTLPSQDILKDKITNNFLFTQICQLCNVSNREIKTYLTYISCISHARSFKTCYFITMPHSCNSCNDWLKPLLLYNNNDNCENLQEQKKEEEEELDYEKISE